ncbi:MAG: hypothetical protein M1819_003376 [Sarea resinae]|nr:MAG: hypothetical protein M1819_003376 [Sarea resinae]
MLAPTASGTRSLLHHLLYLAAAATLASSFSVVPSPTPGAAVAAPLSGRQVTYSSYDIKLYTAAGCAGTGVEFTGTTSGCSTEDADAQTAGALFVAIEVLALTTEDELRFYGSAADCPADGVGGDVLDTFNSSDVGAGCLAVEGAPGSFWFGPKCRFCL